MAALDTAVSGVSCVKAVREGSGDQKGKHHSMVEWQAPQRRGSMLCMTVIQQPKFEEWGRDVHIRTYFVKFTADKDNVLMAHDTSFPQRKYVHNRRRVPERGEPRGDEYRVVEDVVGPRRTRYWRMPRMPRGPTNG